MFYQFLLIFIASLACLTCVPGAKIIKLYEGPALPMDKAAVLSYNAYYLTRSQIVKLANIGSLAENLIVVPAVLKAIDGKSANAFQKGAFDFMLKPGPHTLAVDIKELQKARMNKMKARVYFRFLEDFESNQTIVFEAEEGHKYELLLDRIPAIKIKDTLYIGYFTALFVFDIKEIFYDKTANKIVSAEVPGAFPLKMQDKNLVCYDGEILPPEESALLQVEPGLGVTEIIGEMADGTKLVSGVLFGSIVLKPGRYKLTAQYSSYGSNYIAFSETDAEAKFTAEAGRQYKAKYKNLGGSKWSLIIE